MDLDRIYSAIVEGMASPALACDLQGNLLYMNQAAERFSGWSLQQLAQHPCQDFIRDFPLSTPLQLTHFESPIVTPAGEEKLARVVVWPLPSSGDENGFVLMLEDLRDLQGVLEALRESEIRYRALVENMLNGLVQYRVIFDEKGRAVDAVFSEANLAFEKITGIKRESVIGMRVSEVRRDVDREWVELIGRVALTGIPVRFERHSPRLGKCFAMLAYCPRDGFCAIVSEDITERKQIAEALAASEARYRELVESASNLILKLDNTGRVTFVNRYACDFMGWRCEDVIGRSIIGTIVPHEALSEQELVTALSQLCEEPQQVHDYQYPVVDGAGRQRWISWNIKAICDPNHQLLSILAFGNDITERKLAEEEMRQSEERFRALFESAGDGMAIVDPEGTFLEVNGVLCHRLELSREELLGQPAETIYGHGLIKVLKDALASHDEHGAVFETVETAGSGLTIQAEINARRIRYGGQPALLAISRDISRRRQVEDAERLAALGQLAAGVAHEFNNLLAAMMMKAEVASFREDTPAYQDLAEQVLRSCRRGAEICQNLTAFARPRSLSRQPLRVEEAIETALAISVRQFEYADISLVRDYQTRGHRVLADPAQLEQVFLNLFINAAHAMPQGGRLTIHTRVQPGEGGQKIMVIEVADTGVGIEPQHLSRVFEPFFTTKGRLGRSDTPGTGLGLSVSHGIVTAHGGAISVRSTRGAGSSFTVRLPVWEDVEAVPLAQQAVQRLQAAQPGAGSLVLVAEDEQDIRDLLTEVLRDRGYQVLPAAQTEEALAALDTAVFDLIVADWLMPGGGGREIVNRAEQLPDPPPVIIISGKVGLELSGALRPIVRRSLLKPFHLADLLEAISHTLHPPDGSG